MLVRTQAEADQAADDETFVAKVESMNRHFDACEVCGARQAWLDEHCGPPLDMPRASWTRAFEWVLALPRWTWPSVFGALVVGGFVVVRAVLVVLTNPARLGEAVFAVIAAAGAGAMGGLAFSLTRPLLRRLGRAGDYLSGVVAVCGYMGSLALVAPIAFGETMIDGREDLSVFGILCVMFGLVLGHSAGEGRVTRPPKRTDNPPVTADQ
jgi:hypothetical protein